jgi:hypothetical protein
MIGLILSFLATGAVFFIVTKWVEHDVPNDFQYHDSYFVVVHWGWSTYLGISLVLFILYIIAIIIGRKLMASRAR